MIKIIPQNNWCVIEPIEEKEQVSAGGIIMPGQKEKSKCRKAIVRLMGPKAQEETEAREGDVVLFYSQLPVSFRHEDGKEYLLLKGESFYCVFKEEE